MKRILIVDDEREFCDIVEEMLKSAGYTDIIKCSDSRDAIPIIMEKKPDLVLLDIKMPVITGDVIAAELKNNEETKKIPVVFLTALVGKAEVELHEHVIGNHLFLAKPVKMKDLLQIVREALNPPQEM